MKRIGCFVSMLLCSLLLVGQNPAELSARIKQATDARDLSTMMGISQEIDALYQAGQPDQETGIQYARLWNFIGFQLIKERRYEEAAEGLKTAIERVRPVKAWYERTCSTLGQCYSYHALDKYAQNRYEQALELSAQAVHYALEGLNGNLLVSEHIAIAKSNIALHHLEQAEQALIEAYNYNEQLQGKHYLLYKGHIGYYLGETHVQREDYQGAIELMEEAFSNYYESQEDAAKNQLLSVAQKLETIYRYKLFNQEKAKLWGDIRAELAEEKPQHPEIDNDPMLARAQRLRDIAHMGYQGRYEEALSAYRQLLDEMLGETPVDHATVAESYMNVGTYLIQLQRYGEAVAAYDQSIAHLEGQPASKIAVDSHYFRAIALYHSGDYAASARSAQEAAAIAGRLYDDDSQQLAETYELLANMQAYTGDMQAAKKSLMTLMEITTRNIRKTFAYLTAQERESYWEKMQEYLQIMPPFLYRMREDNSEYTDALYDVQLLCKGLLLQSEIEIQRLTEQSPELRQMTDRLTELKRQIALEQVAPDSIRALKMRAEWLEQEVIAKSQQLGDYLHFLDISHQDVRRALPARTAAIEFATFRYRQDSLMTVAYVMKPEWPHVRVVGLFDQRQFDAIPKRMLYTSPEAYRMIWQPILDAVGEVDTIYFAPSGSLYNTAIEYLPDEDEQYVGDRIPLVRLSSTRRLAMRSGKPQGSRAVLFGGLRYAKDSKWKYLSASLDEVNTLAKLLRKPKLYTADQGNEAAFSSLDGKDYSILHIATHGFSLRVPEEEQQNLHSGLRYCGLVLSGGGDTPAGQSIASQEDGILTAQELSLMDLSRCQIAVLSACRTALGVISSDGVLGLQRGLKMAGVETLIMSLWDVNDQATQLLMTEFYRNWITRHQTKREAFRNAQNTVRKQYEEPEYWAGFILLD